MIGLIGATDFEMETVLREMTINEKKSIGGFEFNIGKIANAEVVAVKSGIGKVFMSTCCQAMLLSFDIERIVNIGAAGCLQGNLTLGDLVLVEQTVQYDMDTTELGEPLGMISGINKVMFDCKIKDGFEDKLKEANIRFVRGNDATADLFCTKQEVKDMLVSKFNCTSCDMEAAALAQICYINNVDIESIKIISDSANDNSSDSYTKYTGTVGDRVWEILNIRFSM